MNHLAVVSLLRSCVLRRNYTIPDRMNDAIVLSPAGRHVRDELVKREKVPAKEAKLLTFLGLVHIEPLIDFAKTDLDAMCAAISEDIQKRELLYPHIFGKDLYCRAAELFKEEREYLRHEDTLALIEDGPIGVFHIHNLLIGPYGVIQTEFTREIEPTTLVPLQHCPDASCGRVHKVQLTTAIEAPVNRHRPSLNKVLDTVSRDPSDWSGYLADLRRQSLDEYSDNGELAVPFIIGDALDDEDLRIFFAHLLDNTDGRLRLRVEALGLQGRSSQIAEGMPRDKVMQLVLTESDSSLARGLDTAIREGVIEVPEGEVRTLRVNSGRRVSAWRLRPQLSSLGYRTVAGNAEHPNLRLGAVIRDLYDLTDEKESDELGWLLRDDGNASIQTRLELLLRSVSPPDLVSRLIFARRANLAKVCQHLGVLEGQSDERTVSEVLWKLGYPAPAVSDLRVDYWGAHRKFERAARGATGQSEEHASELRAAAADHAYALEHYLGRALIYACWALLHDHFSSTQPFVFRVSGANLFARKTLAAAADREGYDGWAESSKLTIASLTSGFGLLARELQHVESIEGALVRPASGRPRFFGKTSMQDFPFLHTAPYLDLDDEAKINLKALLFETTSKISSAQIAEARNSLLHANRSPLRPSILADALDETQNALGRLEGAGLFPKVYEFSRFEVEQWGRGVATLETSDGDQHRLFEPSQFSWVGLPRSTSKQYIARSATFGDGTQALRFRPGFDSNYEGYWADYPRRREPGSAAGADRSDSLSSPVQTGSHVASRAD